MISRSIYGRVWAEKSEEMSFVINYIAISIKNKIIPKKEQNIQVPVTDCEVMCLAFFFLNMCASRELSTTTEIPSD